MLCTVIARRTRDAEELEPLGRLAIDGPFVASRYGDRKLFFQHAFLGRADG